MAKKVGEQSKKQMGKLAFFSSILGVGILLVGGAIFIGKSDTGEIDVHQAISNSNEINREENGDSATIVNNVPNALRDLPNGGLVPQGEVNANPAPEGVPPVAPATTTASTTEEQASTSPQTSEEGAPQQTEPVTEEPPV